jgi:hypothetical protein
VRFLGHAFYLISVLFLSLVLPAGLLPLARQRALRRIGIVVFAANT